MDAAGGVPDPNDPSDLRRTVKYTYYELGDVSNITLKDRYVDPNATPGDPNDYAWHYDLAFYPYTNGTVAAVLQDRWRPDPNGNVDPNDPNQYQALSARGFMYDDPRAKVFDRPLNPTTLEPLSVGDPNAVEQWTDHLGSGPWGNFALTIDNSDDPHTSYHTRWLETLAQQTLDPNAPNADPNDPNDWVVQRYLHGDLIESTGLVTDSGGTSILPVSYTAFGEILDGPGGGLGGGGSPNSGSAGLLPAGHPRFAYAGGWGYESPTAGNTPGPEGGVTLTGVNPNLPPITLQHVGFRWYQPDIGRFVQRDPIGIRAGLNSYNYLDSNAATDTDSSGLIRDTDCCEKCGRLFCMRCFRGPSDPGVGARTFLRFTGGERNTRLDRIGRRIGLRNSSTGDVIGLGGVRVPKGGSLPGGPSTTSIWTKVPGVGLKGGMWLGRFFIPSTLFFGACDWYIIIDSTIQEW